MQHAEAALRVGNRLAAEAADFVAHVAIDQAPKEWHPAHIIHARAEKQFGARGGRAKEAINFLRQDAGRRRRE